MSEKINSNDEKIYQSGELLFNILQKEYEYDFSNLNSLYTRTGIIFAFSGLYLKILLDKPIDLNMPVSNHKLVDFIIYLSPLLYFGSLFFICVCMYFLFKVILTNKYQRVDINKGFNEESALMKKELTAYYMMEIYTKILKFNKELWERKFGYYRKANLYLRTSLILFVIYIFIIYIWRGKI